MSQLHPYTPTEGHSLPGSNFDDLFSSNHVCQRLDTYLTPDGKILICCGPHFMEPNTNTIDMSFRFICTRYGKVMARKRIRFDVQAPREWILIRSAVALDEATFILLYTHYSHSVTLYVRKVTIGADFEPKYEIIDVPMGVTLPFPMNYAFAQENSLIMIMRPWVEPKIAQIGRVDLTTKKFELWKGTPMVTKHQVSPSIKNNKLYLLDLETFDCLSIQHLNSDLSYEQTIPEPHPCLCIEPCAVTVPLADSWMVLGRNQTNKSLCELWRLTVDPLQWHLIVSVPSSQLQDLFPTSYLKRHASSTPDGIYVNVYGNKDNLEFADISKRFMGPSPPTLAELAFRKLVQNFPGILSMEFEVQRMMGIPLEFCQPKVMDNVEVKDPLIGGYWKKDAFVRYL